MPRRQSAVALGPSGADAQHVNELGELRNVQFCGEEDIVELHLHTRRLQIVGIHYNCAAVEAESLGSDSPGSALSQ